MSKEGSLFTALMDMCKSLKLCPIITVLSLSVVGGMALYLFKLQHCFNFDDFYSTCIGLVGTLLGFGITAFAVILNFSSEKINKLNYSNNNIKPYDHVCAEFLLQIITGTISLIILIIALIFEIRESMMPYVFGAAIFDLLWSANLAIHLFTLRTFN